MSAAILKMKRNGTPATLIDNLAEIAPDIEFMLVVRVMRNGRIEHDWTHITNSLTALGAAETLKDAMLKACE
jgi:hypothetical protein